MRTISDWSAVASSTWARSLTRTGAESAAAGLTTTSRMGRASPKEVLEKTL